MDGEEREWLRQVSEDLAYVKGTLADLPKWRDGTEKRLIALEKGQAYQKGIAAAVSAGISMAISGAAAWFGWHR
jgi:hypothetical protein